MNRLDRQQHVVRDFTLASGAVLPLARTTYVTCGTLDAARSNAVLVLHALSSGPAMLDPDAAGSAGSWAGLVGPGRAIDTRRWFVVCPNALGSCHGSTGPSSRNPATGRRYGADFPAVTIGDMVALQQRLVDSLGIGRLAAVVGPSMGAYQAFQWAVDAPARVERVVAVAGAPFHPAGAGLRAQLAGMLSRGPAGTGGTPAQERQAMVDHLTRFRVEMLRRGGFADELRARLADAAQAEAMLAAQARAWALDVDPSSLLVLAGAMERFDVRDRLDRMRAPLLWVLSRSDKRFPPALFAQAGPRLDAAGVRWTPLVIDSDRGHDAAGAEPQLWDARLRAFLSAAAEPAPR